MSLLSYTTAQTKELTTVDTTNKVSMIANSILNYTEYNICSLPRDNEKVVQFLSG